MFRLRREKERLEALERKRLEDERRRLEELEKQRYYSFKYTIHLTLKSLIIDLNMNASKERESKG